MDILLGTTPDGETTYLAWLLSGAAWTVALALLAWGLALACGTLVGVARTLDGRIVRALASGYVEAFRNVPLIVQLFLWYFVMPELLPERWGDAIKQLDPLWTSFASAVIGLGLYTSARVAEQIRAGLQALPRGQREAASALALCPSLLYRKVLLPQAFRVILPALTNEFMSIFKNSSVALTIGVLELSAQARQINEYTFHTFLAYGSATLGYLAIALVAYALMHGVERSLRIPGLIEATGARP